MHDAEVAVGPVQSYLNSPVAHECSKIVSTCFSSCFLHFATKFVVTLQWSDAGSAS